MLQEERVNMSVSEIYVLHVPNLHVLHVNDRYVNKTTIIVYGHVVLAENSTRRESITNETSY